MAGGKLLRTVKKKSSLPSEATYSRAFKEFAESELGDIIHKALVEEYLSEQLIVHISRDATAIAGNEKPAKKDKEEREAKPAKKGRPKKGEVRPEKEEKRINLGSNCF